MNLGELEAITMWPAWEWFGTLTFRGTPPGHGKAKAMALNYLFRVARLAKVRFSSLVWVLREEEGEQGGRRHFHFLLSGTSLPLSPAGCHILQRVWERVGGGRGFAKVKVYDRALSGAAYVTKCLSWVGTADGAHYELRKFARTEEPPMLSKSLVCRLRRLIDRDHRRLYLPDSGGEGSLRNTVKAGQPMATWDGFAPGNPGTDRPNDDKTGTRSIPPAGCDAPF